MTPIYDLIQIKAGPNTGTWAITVDDEIEESLIFNKKEEAEQELTELKRGDYGHPTGGRYDKRTRALWSRGETLDPDQF